MGHISPLSVERRRAANPGELASGRSLHHFPRRPRTHRDPLTSMMTIWFAVMESTVFRCLHKT
nr:MAG TPA: hypothetical protein [Caudoviricetes sp.]